MRTSLLLLVPCILLGGLIFGVVHLQGFAPGSATCALGECPVSIHESDSGHTFSYSVGARFSVFMDENSHPKNELRCLPDGVIAFQHYAPTEPPTYTAQFESVATGTCVLTDKDFSATIFIQ